MATYREHDRVAALLREVAGTIIMPRWRRLGAGDCHEKSPGEIVTIADREAEAALAEGLRAIDPAPVLGEEAVEADPALLDLVTAPALWIVDPVDGTGNFARGETPFGIIIARVEGGAVIAGWLYDPVRGRLCHAVRGGGAWIEGVRLRVPHATRPRPIAALATRFLTADARQTLEERAATAFDLVPIPRCAAEHYPRLALAGNDIALFQRTLPWDHAAGALLLEEAGGKVARWDGAPYALADGRRGLIAAGSPALWAQAQAVLIGAGLLDERAELLPPVH